MAFRRGPPPSPSMKARIEVPSRPTRSARSTRARCSTRTGSSLPAPHGASRARWHASSVVAPSTASVPSTARSAAVGSNAAADRRSFRNAWKSARRAGSNENPAAIG
jgi:hypothetical protein